MIGCSTFLELAQGFGLVTPDPFSSRELGAVWARDYLSSSPSYINIARLLMFHLLYSLVFSIFIYCPFIYSIFYFGFIKHSTTV